MPGPLHTTTIQSYTVDATTGALTALQSITLSGLLTPAFAVHPSGKYLYVTDSTNLYTYSIASDGTLTQTASVALPTLFLGCTLLLNPTASILLVMAPVGQVGLSVQVFCYSISSTGVLTILTTSDLYGNSGSATPLGAISSNGSTVLVTGVNQVPGTTTAFQGAVLTLSANGITSVNPAPLPSAATFVEADGNPGQGLPLAVHPTLPVFYRAVSDAATSVLKIQIIACNGGNAVTQGLFVMPSPSGFPFNENITLNIDSTGSYLYASGSWFNASSVFTYAVQQFAIDASGNLSALTPITPTSGTIDMGVMGYIGNAGKTAYNAVLNQSFAAMTPWHIVYRPCTNSKTDGTATTDQSNLLYFIDRNRTGYWSIFNYPAASAPGTSNPYFATVYPVDQNFYFGGGDGNVYCQPIRVADVNQAEGIFEVPQFTPDDFNQSVVSVYRGKLSEQGDALLQKQCKMWWAPAGQSAPNSCSLMLRYFGTDGNFYTYSPSAGQNRTLPFEAAINLQESQEQGAVVNYFLIQTQITGSNLWMKGHGMVWRGVRYSGSSNLNP